MAAQAERRQYRSPLRERRAAETKAALLAAAQRLFVARGWAGAGMRDIATEAGVAMETAYAHFASKRGLLRAVIDVAAAGDDQPVALAERAEFVALGRGRRAQRIAAGARLLTGIQERTGPMAKVIREAATTDPEIADILRDTRERQRVDTARGFELIVGRPPTNQERDGMWAIACPEVYLLLVDESGWSPEQYEQWIAQTLERVLPRA